MPDIRNCKSARPTFIKENEMQTAMVVLALTMVACAVAIGLTAALANWGMPSDFLDTIGFDLIVGAFCLFTLCGAALAVITLI